MFTTQALIMAAAIAGSTLYLFDKIAALIQRSMAKKKGNEQQQQQADIIRLKDAQIDQLQARIRFLESEMAALRRQRYQQIVAKVDSSESADPVAREAEAKADEALAQARSLALAAIDAQGREKSRLIAQARKLSERAKEYRRIARGELPTDHAEAHAQAVIKKAKQLGNGSARFEVLGEE